MSKEKLTPWFPGNVKPVRKGVYERDWLDGGPQWFSYWDGKNWCFGDETAEGAKYAANMLHTSAHTNFPWRGLAQDPKAKP